MNPNQQNPYDFIQNTGQQKKSILSANTSKKARIIQVVIFATVLLIIGFIALNLLTAGSKSTTEKLLKVAAAQQDLIELSEIGTSKARDAESVTRSSTTVSVVRTQNAELVSYLSKNGVKNASKQVAKYRDTSFQKTLVEAEKNGNFDEAYKAIYANRLDLYRSSLQVAYDAVSGATIKKQLESDYSQLTVITPTQK